MIKHIAIEGFDGAGKTTLAKKLAEILNFKYIEKPLSYILGDDNYLKAAKYINATQNELIRALFYSLGNAYTVNNFDKVVTDRHILSSFSYNYSDLTKDLYNVLNKHLRQPDLTILLDCNNSIRRQRIIKRNPQDKDILRVDDNNSKKFKEMECFLKYNNYNYIVIDNSNLSINELLEISLKEIKKQESKCESVK